MVADHQGGEHQGRVGHFRARISPSGPKRRSIRLKKLVAVGGIADMGGRPAPAQFGAHDPQPTSTRRDAPRRAVAEARHGVTGDSTLQPAYGALVWSGCPLAAY
jgi:hypothetical protein